MPHKTLNSGPDTHLGGQGIPYVSARVPCIIIMQEDLAAEDVQRSCIQ